MKNTLKYVLCLFLVASVSLLAGGPTGAIDPEIDEVRADLIEFETLDAALDIQERYGARIAAFDDLPESMDAEEVEMSLMLIDAGLLLMVPRIEVDLDAEFEKIDNLSKRATYNNHCGDGSPYDDVINAAGGCSVSGKDGHDLINGGPGSDYAYGNNGNDTFKLGPGTSWQTASGSTGNDIFYYYKGDGILHINGYSSDFDILYARGNIEIEYPDYQGLARIKIVGQSGYVRIAPHNLDRIYAYNGTFNGPFNYSFP